MCRWGQEKYTPYLNIKYWTFDWISAILMVRLFRPLLRQAGRDVRIALCEGHRARGVRIATPVTSVAGSQGQFFGSAVRIGGGFFPQFAKK